MNKVGFIIIAAMVPFTAAIAEVYSKERTNAVIEICRADVKATLDNGAESMLPNYIRSLDQEEAGHLLDICLAYTSGMKDGIERASQY
jgi:hypothetical protein